MRRLIPLILFLPLAAAAQSQLGLEIAQRHAERAGEKLANLTAYRAEGRTFIGNQEVPFVLWAQRPNRLRIESSTLTRRLVQVYDGEHAPWASHSEVADGAAQTMTGAEAREFMASADFDDPLVDFEAKGYSVDYAGEDDLDGRRAHKLLVMSKTDDICFLWVDAESSEIVRRMTYRIVNDQRAVIDTFFKDFKPVAGVLLPHKVEARTAGRAIYTTLIDKMEPNPRKMAPTLFARPGGWPEEPKAAEVKVERSSVEATNKEEQKPEGPKVEASRGEETTAEGMKKNEPLGDAAKTDAPKVEVPKPAEAKSDEPKTDEPKTEAPKNEDPKLDEPKKAELASDEFQRTLRSLRLGVLG